VARIPLVSDRDGLVGEQLEVFDWVVESRGQMIRPYEVLLHVPGIARPAAELGHQIRYVGTLSDHDRELAIITAAVVNNCAFEWDSHAPLAVQAGVRAEAMAVVQGADGELTAGESVIVDFVQELNATGSVSDATHEAAVDALGVGGTVELATLAGYYTMLGYVMNVAGVC
jgi:4-carboxymuconolactone decarboxylase